MKKILIILMALSFFGCGKKHRSEKVEIYKTHSYENNSNDFILYYYLFYMNNGSCYYYSSPTPVSDYSNVSWTQSATSPLTGVNEDNIEQVSTENITTDQFNSEMQVEFDSNPGNFSGMSEDEMGDYEGGESESNNDAGSGSDGGGDSGGGGE